MRKPGLWELTSWFGRSPLTDPRSLFSSTLFHGLLLLLASAAALSAVVPSEPEGPRAIQAELDPVDNRAKTEGEGGGAPGALGNQGLAAALATLTPSPTSSEGAP